MDVEEITPKYRWEQGVSASWEAVTEDSKGLLQPLQSQNNAQSDRYRVQMARSRRSLNHSLIKTSSIVSVRRGILRFQIVCLDCSSSSQENDNGYRPSRLQVSFTSVKQYIAQFFDQNPLSQLGICSLNDGIVQKVSDLSSNARSHQAALEKAVLKNKSCGQGNASLQNALIYALAALEHVPRYGHKELVVVFNSIRSIDPGDIFETLQLAIRSKIRVSIISLPAEIFICKTIANETGGTYNTSLDATHLSELLSSLATPPLKVVAEDDENRKEALSTDFVYVGFPRRVQDIHPSYGYDGNNISLLKEAYVCPRCLTRTAQVPTQCVICRLQLNPSAHIARSYHHLYPVPPYEVYRVQKELESGGESFDETMPVAVKAGEFQQNNATAPSTIPLMGEASRCRGCFKSFIHSESSFSSLDKERLAMRCPLCSSLFCVDCDLFVHDSLHNCPGC